MKRLSCLLIVPVLAAAMAPDEAKVETVITVSRADRYGDVAEWVRVGSLVDVVAEEPGMPATRTIFEARRVSAVGEDKKDKNSLVLTVYLTTAQAKAFEAFKDTSKFRIERTRDRYSDRDKDKK
jgi:hypothetical protein